MNLLCYFFTGDANHGKGSGYHGRNALRDVDPDFIQQTYPDNMQHQESIEQNDDRQLQYSDHYDEDYPGQERVPLVTRSSEGQTRSTLLEDDDEEDGDWC